jgi:hypothetical protein
MRAPASIRLLCLREYAVSPSFVTGERYFARTTPVKAYDSGPGWKGRDHDDHAVNRPPLDPEAEAAHSGMEKHEKGEDGGSALSQKDEGDNNKRAKEDNPEAPEPVLGVNDGAYPY